MNTNTHTIFERDGYQLHVQKQGRGPNLIIIGSVAYYTKVIPPTLSQHFTCIFVDHRGFAVGSKDKSFDVDLNILSNDLEYICHQLGISIAHLLGHSGHAFMALHFANNTLLEIKGVFLIGAPPSLSDEMHAAQLNHWEEKASFTRKQVFEKNIAHLESDIAKQPDKKFVHLCRRLGAMRWANPEFDELKLWQDVPTNTDILDTLWGELFRDSKISAYLKGFDVTVINGELDFSIAPLSVWSELSQQYKNLRLIELKGVSHTPMYEAPDEFVSLLCRLTFAKHTED